MSEQSPLHSTPLHSVLKIHGESRAGAALSLGLSRRSLGRYLDGRVQVPVSVLGRAAALLVSVSGQSDFSVVNKADAGRSEAEVVVSEGGGVPLTRAQSILNDLVEKHGGNGRQRCV